MKNVIVYGIIFLLAFVMVTGAIFFMNSKYKNIFAFDFSPETGEQQKKKENPAGVDSLNSVSQAVPDSSVTVQDSTKKEEDLSKVDIVEAKITKDKIAEPVPVTENPMLPKTNNKQTAKKDSIYNAWLKETVKLYEAMDSKKVAKVILAYSDNIARDLILRMRKKKAAEVLSEFKPEVVTRLISVN